MTTTPSDPSDSSQRSQNSQGDDALTNNVSETDSGQTGGDTVGGASDPGNGAGTAPGREEKPDLGAMKDMASGSMSGPSASSAVANKLGGDAPEGSTRAAAAGIAAGATKGAEMGAKLGGVGAPVGAAVGGAMAATKTKQGRAALVVGIAMSLMMVFGPLIMMVTTTNAILTMAVGKKSEEETNAREYAQIDGVSAEVIEYADRASDYGNFPWVMTAAMMKIYGVTPGDEASLSASSLEEALELNTPIGPWQLQPNDIPKLYGTYNLDQKGVDEPEDARDYLLEENATPFVMALVGAKFAEIGPDNPEIAASAFSMPNAEDGGSYLEIDPNSPEAKEVRNAYIDALSEIPSPRANELAPQIFDTALAWTLGRSAACVADATPAAYFGGDGTWVNPVKGSVSSAYGMRFHPIRKVMSLHDGVDVSAPDGQPVFAASAGTVKFAGYAEAYGPHWVIVDHGNGTQTEYGHMSADVVEVGDSVGAGQQIGAVGSLGYSTGPHLHFSVRKSGTTTDPVAYLKSKGVVIGSGDTKPPAGGSVPVGSESTLPTPVSGTGSTGEITVAQANIPERSGLDGFRSSMPKVLSTNPDFVSLNEVGFKSMATIKANAPGYDGYRNENSPPGQQGRALGSVVLWKADKWSLVRSGRIQIVDNDVYTFQGQTVDWDRFATWATLRRADGSQASIISVHHMTNPAKSVASEAPERKSKYGAGMDLLIGLTSTLAASGPVFVAGDLNTHDEQISQPWSAVAKMKAAGFRWYNHSVDYVFAPAATASLVRGVNGDMASDHNWVSARWAVGPGATSITVDDVANGGTGAITSFSDKSTTGQTITLNEKQLGYARGIIAKANEMGMNRDAIIIALMTVTVESGFRMYASDKYASTLDQPHDAVGSDYDSVGLFQQRPVSGWGPRITGLANNTAANRLADAVDLMNVEYSTAAFFGGPKGPNNGSPMGLLDHKNWQSMSKGDAAQDVQVSAFPDKYAAWEGAMTRLYEALGNAPSGETAGCEGTTIIGAQADGLIDTFTVASFNLGGDESSQASMDETPAARFPDAMSYIEDSSASVAGLREFGKTQWKVFNEDYPAWKSFPGSGNSENAIIWRAKDWNVLAQKTIAVPFYGGRNRPMPYVLLENRASGDRYYFVNVHNPDDAEGNAEKYRKRALEVQQQHLERLKAAGNPVILTGSFNDSGDAKTSQCVFTPLLMKNVFGESVGCTPPSGANDEEHIYVTPSLNVTSKQVYTAPLGSDVSDQPMITATFGNGASGRANAAIEWAVSQVGKGYSQDGDLRMGPTHFDCSGLVYRAFQSIGIELGGWTGEQKNDGTRIAESDLRPGDLIFYYAPISHVAIYMGEVDGVEMIVHAANPKDGVETQTRSSMRGDEVLYRRIV